MPTRGRFISNTCNETLGPRIGRGRSVIEQFGHLQDARVMWLAAVVPGATPTVTKLGRGAHSAERVSQALDASAAAIAVLLDRHKRSGSDAPAFRNSAAAFLAYLVAHDAHHRGYVAAFLKQRGSPVPRAISFGIWEWSRPRIPSSPRNRQLTDSAHRLVAEPWIIGDTPAMTPVRSAPAHATSQDTKAEPDGSRQTAAELTAIIERDGDGYVALCPEIDVASQGSTVQEARGNLQEALELFFETASESEIARRLRSEVYVTRVQVPVPASQPTAIGGL